jgi:hypothetical protein
VVIGKVSAVTSGSRDQYLDVYSARVPDPGCGVGTRLYEALAREACDRGVRLRSDSSRSTYSEGFWKKQEGKGRAEQVNYRFVLKPCETNLEGRKSLPRKRRR